MALEPSQSSSLSCPSSAISACAFHKPNWRPQPLEGHNQARLNALLPRVFPRGGAKVISLTEQSPSAADRESSTNRTLWNGTSHETTHSRTQRLDHRYGSSSPQSRRANPNSRQHRAQRCPWAASCRQLRQFSRFRYCSSTSNRRYANLWALFQLGSCDTIRSGGHRLRRCYATGDKI